MCRGFESHPSSSFFFSEKKELFGLVALPFFLFIGLRVFMYFSHLIFIRTVEPPNNGQVGHVHQLLSTIQRLFFIGEFYSQSFLSFILAES